MENKPQKDSPQKSPVPPSDNKDAKPEAPSASASSQPSESATSSASQNVPEPNSATESKPGAFTQSEGNTDKNSEGSNTETNLQHPIISIDIKKSTASDAKKEVPQESKSVSAEVPPEVLASVVTKAVVTEAALAVGGNDGLVNNGTKVSGDTSKVESVVDQELNKISEAIREKTQPKGKDDVKSDTKPLPNGDIDHSPVKGVTGSEQDLKETTNKASGNAQSSESKGESSADQSNGSKTEACKNNEAAAQNQNKLNQTQNSEISSCNGVPGIITVVGISKKDSTQNLHKEVGESTKSDNVSEIVNEKDGTTKEENSKDKESDTKGSSKKFDDRNELASVVGSQVDSEEKANIGEISIGDNLTDSAKIQSSVQKVYHDIDSSQNIKEISDDNNPIKNHDNKDDDSSKPKPATENESKKSVSQIDNEKDEDTQEKFAEDSKEKTETLDKSEIESLSDKTSTKEPKASNEGKKTPEQDDEPKIESLDASKQTKSSSISKPEATSATSDSATKNTTTESEEGTEELCDMSMMASMTTSQILTEEMLNGSSMEQDKNKKNLSLDAKDEKHKVEVCSIASATSGTCDIGVGSDERVMIRCASGDGGEEEVGISYVFRILVKMTGYSVFTMNVSCYFTCNKIITLN